MSRPGDCDRRRFIGTTMSAIAGARLFASRSGGARGPARPVGARPPGVRYTESGPVNGPAVILLQGRRGASDGPVARLAARGYRVIVPCVTGSAAADVMALVAAIKVDKALVGVFGESARPAEAAAALWPQRVKGIIPDSGSGEVTLAAAQRSLPPNEELAWWYQYYFTRNGEA